MADLTLNFSDASFDNNDDYFINPGNGLIYEMGTTDPLKNGSNQNITATSTGITGGAFTLAHNQHFMFEFEDTGAPLDSDPTNVDTGDDYKVTVHTHGMSATDPGQSNSITMDISQADINGDSSPDTIAHLVNGTSAGIQVTRKGFAANDPDQTYTQYIGDGTVAGNTSWILSGDTNGGQLDDSGGSFGFYAGHYGGVFLGGTGQDTLVFNHQNETDTAQMYVDLSGGIALFGNNVGSPLVQFAEIGGASYSLTWERLEMMGDSNDFVVVGSGLQQVDSSAAARKLDTTDFFEIDLGSGDDELYVTDASQSILLDLSKTGDHTVTLSNSGKDMTIDVSGSEMSSSGYGMDSMTIDITGVLDSATSPTSGVIDYIDFGDGQNNKVVNNSDQGIAVKFGSSKNASGVDGTGADEFLGSADTGSDLIDLRGVQNVTVTDSFYTFDGGGNYNGMDLTTPTNGNHIVDIAGSGNVEIEATNVDLLYVSSADINGNMNTADSDVLVNAEHLYGQGKGLFGMDLLDVDYSGYDVVTSASLKSWDGASDLQIYYDGNHNAFIDTGDTLSRDASSWNVATTGAYDAESNWVSTVSGEQKLWDTQIQADTGGAATPSFYILTAAQKKVPVYLDESDPSDVKWKVDINEFEISSDTTITTTTSDTMAIKKAIKDAYDIDVSQTALQGANAVYLNATESDISYLLANGDVTSGNAFDFGFYTQVVGTVGEGANSQQVFVNVGLTKAGSGVTTSFSLNAEDVHVKTDYNTVDTDYGMAIGGTGTDFVELGAQGAGENNIAMGNAGNDTYVVDASDNGVINELGSLMSSADLSNADSIQFELVEDIADLDFSRGRIAGEADGSTLFIDGSAGGDGQATLFDQYNSFLSFRKTEYLVIDDGADSSEIFELVTGDPTANTWANEVYVAKGGTGTDSITVNVGGTDHVFLGDSTDTVTVADTGFSANDKVTVHNIGSGDKIIYGGTEHSLAASTNMVEITDSGITEFTI